MSLPVDLKEKKFLKKFGSWFLFLKFMAVKIVQLEMSISVVILNLFWMISPIVQF